MALGSGCIHGRLSPSENARSRIDDLAGSTDSSSGYAAAIIAAANTVWPPRTIGLRILDREGREVFARQKAARRSG